MDIQRPVFLKLWPRNMPVISDKYVAVISNKYIAIISDKVCGGYIPQDKNVAVSNKIRPKN